MAQHQQGVDGEGVQPPPMPKVTLTPLAQAALREASKDQLGILIHLLQSSAPNFRQAGASPAEKLQHMLENALKAPTASPSRGVDRPGAGTLPNFLGAGAGLGGMGLDLAALQQQQLLQLQGGDAQQLQAAIDAQALQRLNDEAREGAKRQEAQQAAMNVSAEDEARVIQDFKIKLDLAGVQMEQLRDFDRGDVDEFAEMYFFDREPEQQAAVIWQWLLKRG